MYQVGKFETNPFGWVQHDQVVCLNAATQWETDCLLMVPVVKHGAELCFQMALCHG